MRDSLVRMEYKLDLIIQALMDYGIMVSDLPDLKGISSDRCPVCKSKIHVVPDFKSETPVYTCGCVSPARVVSGISAITPERNNNDERYSEDPVSPNEPPTGDRVS